MHVIVGTAYGKLRGTASDGVTRFLGVPYAAPPFGPHRFRPPQPPVAWDGVRDADAYGPTAPKAPYPAPLDALLQEVAVDGEDCLNLNIWAPAAATAAPVMVWIHGGAFRNGSGSAPAYDGSGFARDGVVCVTFNYRLGVEGFAELPGAPRNRGLLDQIAALAWVRDNIAAFGGDPGNVTVFGESAGAMSVTTLLALDLGLFRRAIAQSGAGQILQEPEDASKVTAAVADRLGVAPTAEAFAAVGPAEVVAAQAEVAAHVAAFPDPRRWGISTVRSGMAFMPVRDDTLLPRPPIEAVRDGAGRGVDVLIGSNTEEFRLYLAPGGLTKLLSTDAAARFLDVMGFDPAYAAAYAANRPDARPGDLAAAVATDGYFRMPAYRVAEARAGAAATWVYEFAWRSGATGPADELGACHALEIGFVFDTLDRLDGAGHSGHAEHTGLAGPNPPQSLADAMHAAWVAFARDGDPGWPTYDTATRPVRVFDTETRLVHDPRSDERALWPER
ncbi:carboxylesterase/lipase family protein [Yinghuangia sp. YIM S09857]|uniref:carboxylesterase/lipase family protein n=1 Tax=Yinghuangia sp. YIM S09857 TaxID=3436929 RepID=UPI003F52A5B6